MDMELMEIPEGIPRRKLLVWLTNMALIVYGVGVLFFFDGIEFWVWFVPTIIVLVVCSVYIYVWSRRLGYTEYLRRWNVRLIVGTVVLAALTALRFWLF